MAITLDSIITGSTIKPPIIMIMGTHAIGKTSLGAAAPNPIFLRTEDGLGDLDVPTFPLFRTYDEVMQAIGVLYSEEHSFQTMVLDSLDHLETLVFAQTCKDNNFKSISEPKFQAGYKASLDYWRALLDGIRALRDERNMTIVLLSHVEVKRTDPPDSDPYDRYVPKLYKDTAALLQEIADCVLFCNYRISTLKSDAGFGRTITRAVGGGNRVINTEERPAFVAKNRYAMPPTLSLDSAAQGWAEIAAHIPALAGKQAVPQASASAEAAE